MLRGLFTLCLIFGIGISLLAVISPANFAALKERMVETWHSTTANFQSVKGDSTDNSPDIIQAIDENRKDIGVLTTDDIIDETNKARIANNLSPLKKNTKLDASAKLKVDDMIALHYFEHESPSGKNVADLGDAVHYSYIVMGENLALGNFASAQELVQAWMNSPGHRANILNTKYQDIGVYAGIGTYNGNTVWFAVQHFGTQKTVCPAISATLKQSITATTIDLANREKEIEALKAVLETPGAQDDPGYEEKVAEFNTLVEEYNAIVLDSKQKTAQYNAQVTAFNACLVKFQ